MIADFLFVCLPALIVVAIMILLTVRPLRRTSWGGFMGIVTGGLAVILGIVLLVVAGLEPMVAAEIKACESAETGYDCEDAGLLLAIPLLSGMAAAVLWILSTLCLRFMRGTTRLKTGDAL